MEIKKGDILLVNFKPVKGSEQGGIRPCLVIQNDISNKFSPVTIVSAITSKVSEKEYPTDVFISKQESNLNNDSTILLNQIRTVDKLRIIKKIGIVDNFIMNKVDKAIKISLGIN